MKQTATLIFALLFLAACKKEDTVWDTDWSAPLINDTLSLKHLVNDSTLANDGGYYTLDLTRTLFDLNVSDFVSIPDTTIEQSYSFNANLPLSPGFSFVNNQEEHDLDMKGIELKFVILKGGEIDIRLENPLPTITHFTVTLPGVKKDGITLTRQFTAPPGSTSNPGISEESVDLSGYELDLTGATGGSANKLRSLVAVSTDINGPSVTITPADVTRVKATFHDVQLHYARGYFGNDIVSDTSEVFLEIMNSITSGMIDLPNTSITFEIVNGIKVSAEGTLLTAENTNAQGNTVNLTGGQMGTSFNINPATGNSNTLTPSVKSITFNSANSNIEQFVENLGANQKLGYQMQLNPWGNISGGYDELFPNSRLTIRMKAQMPLNIGMYDLTLRDTFDITLNQDPEKTHVKSGELILKASNGFPISGSVKLHMLAENGGWITTIIGSSELRSSVYGSFKPEHNMNVCDSEIHFVIPESLVDVIDNVKKIVVETSFNTPNSSTNLNEQVSIPYGAFLGVKLKAKLVTENRF
jgi:hypothetical protein